MCDEHGETLVQLPVYTDIQDDTFLKHVKDAVESAWHFEGEGIHARVIIDFRRRTVAELYGTDPVPQPNTASDVTRHVTRAPLDSAVLTTGATSTYAIAGHYIALGPTSIAPNVIAHEFG